MEFVLNAVKADLTGVIEAGRYLLISFFSVAVLVNYLGILQNKANWSGLITRLVIGFILLQNYVWFMDITKEIITGLDERINPQQSYIMQYAQMSTNLQASYEAQTQKNIISGISGFVFGKNTLHNLIINLSFIFYAIVSKIMEAIRYSLVAIMYKLGPILVPMILFDSTKRVLQGWFTSYVSILAWPILWHVALSVAVALSQSMASSGEGIEEFACINFAVCFVLIFSPMIVSSLVSGIGIGGAAALAGFLSSRMVYNTFTQAGRSVSNTISSVFGGNGRSYTQTPTMRGAFRRALTKNSNGETKHE